MFKCSIESACNEIWYTEHQALSSDTQSCLLYMYSVVPDSLSLNAFTDCMISEAGSYTNERALSLTNRLAC